MIYARVHDQTAMADYLRAMEGIEGEQTAITKNQNSFALLPVLAFFASNLSVF
jgi:hypothetical protein